MLSPRWSVLAALGLAFLAGDVRAGAELSGTQLSRVLGRVQGEGRALLGAGLKWAGEREVVQMIAALGDVRRLGAGSGWFHPARCRYDWDWLARRHGKDKEGAISREEFRGAPQLFAALDRDNSGAITRADLHWSQPKPERKPEAKLEGKPEEKPEAKPDSPPAAPTPDKAVQAKERAFALVLLGGILTGEVGSLWEGPGPGARARISRSPRTMRQGRGGSPSFAARSRWC